ncbi:unnamed protein product, partial [Allacma fusca]
TERLRISFKFTTDSVLKTKVVDPIVREVEQNQDIFYEKTSYI